MIRTFMTNYGTYLHVAETKGKIFSFYTGSFPNFCGALVPHGFFLRSGTTGQWFENLVEERRASTGYLPHELMYRVKPVQEYDELYKELLASLFTGPSENKFYRQEVQPWGKKGSIFMADMRGGHADESIFSQAKSFDNINITVSPYYTNPSSGNTVRHLVAIDMRN